MTLEERIGAFAIALENEQFDSVRDALGQRMCCNGVDCGCRGASVGEYLAWELRAALAVPKPDGSFAAPLPPQAATIQPRRYTLEQAERKIASDKDWGQQWGR